MKKQTKKSLKNKLDKIVSEIVRSHGLCVMCGIGDYSKLQCAHIYSRHFMNTRFDLKNMLCLCASCHFQAHQKPLLFSEFVKQYLGDYEYTQLKLKADAIKKWSVDDMKELLDTYKKLKEGGIK